MSTNGWGKASINNTNGFGDGAINNDIGWGDSQLKSWSGETDIDGGTGIPVNTVAPVISGATTLGSVLSTTNGTWTAKPAATFTYQWKRNGSNIIGATNSTYTLVNEDGATNITCQVTATNDFGSASATSNTLAIPAFTDADAQAFITAASITDPTQQSAINTLVTDLKGYGVWTKMKALYPFVGGTASQHSYNLKNTAQFQITWNGGVTNSSTGVTFNGTNGFGNTGLNDSTILNIDNKHISMYQRNVLVSFTGSSMGISNSNRFYLNFDNQNYSTLGMNQSPFAVQTPQRGMFVMSKTANGSFKYFQNALTPVTKTGTNNAQNLNYFVGASNNGGSGFDYTSANLAFASIGDGLTDTEAANFYTAVQTFQTTLGRQVGTPIPLSGNLLNDYPDAKGAYSVARRLSTNYTGSLIRVRRSSDNAEQNIGYTGANILDEAALTSFVGSSDGFVTTWYDQSGNNLNIIQTTANKQPRIVNAGTVIKTNGKAAMQFDGSNDELTQASLRGDTRADQYYVIQATDTQYLYPNYLGSAYGFVAQDGSTSGGAGNSYGTPSLYVNNALASTATRNDVHDVLNGQKIALHENSNTAIGWATIAWGAYAGFEFSGLWQEYIYYNSDQSANRTGINNNINGFYTIY